MTLTCSSRSLDDSCEAKEPRAHLQACLLSGVGVDLEADLAVDSDEVRDPAARGEAGTVRDGEDTVFLGARFGGRQRGFQEEDVAAPRSPAVRTRLDRKSVV